GRRSGCSPLPRLDLPRTSPQSRLSGRPGLCAIALLFEGSLDGTSRAGGRGGESALTIALGVGRSEVLLSVTGSILSESFLASTVDAYPGSTSGLEKSLLAARADLPEEGALRASVFFRSTCQRQPHQSRGSVWPALFAGSRGRTS